MGLHMVLRGSDFNLECASLQSVRMNSDKFTIDRTCMMISPRGSVLNPVPLFGIEEPAGQTAILSEAACSEILKSCDHGSESSTVINGF